MMPQQGNYTSINWGCNTFYCYLNNDDIYQYNGEIIGVSLNKYKLVEEALLKCKNKLIELGEIEVPKTQEQIIQEQNEMLKNMMQMYKELQQKVEANNEYSENQKCIRDVTAGDKGQSDERAFGSFEDNRPNGDTDKRASNTGSTKAKK
jgi:hypothetical protein